jgi:hypothetical protein
VAPAPVYYLPSLSFERVSFLSPSFFFFALSSLAGRISLCSMFYCFLVSGRLFGNCILVRFTVFLLVTTNCFLSLNSSLPKNKPTPSQSISYPKPPNFSLKPLSVNPQHRSCNSSSLAFLLTSVTLRSGTIY